MDDRDEYGAGFEPGTRGDLHIDAETGRVDDRAAIRADIRETRERMSHTLDQIGERLNTNRLKTQARDTIREATIGRVQHMARNAADRVNESRYSLMDTIRDNPIPAAMVGVGLGWLLVNSRREERQAQPYVGASYATGYHGDLTATTPRLMQDDAGGGIGSTVSDTGEPGMVDRLRDGAMEATGGVVERVRERTSDMSAGAVEAASGVVDRTRTVVSDVAGRTGEVAGSVAQRARGVAGSVAERSRSGMHAASSRFDEAITMNPLAVGAAAVALGVVAGLAVPHSRREDELMGDARDRLVDRVRERVNETRHAATRVAQEVLTEAKDTAREAAREEGLMGESGNRESGYSAGSTGTGSLGADPLGGGAARNDRYAG